MNLIFPHFLISQIEFRVEFLVSCLWYLCMHSNFKNSELCLGFMVSGIKGTDINGRIEIKNIEAAIAAMIVWATFVPTSTYPPPFYLFSRSIIEQRSSMEISLSD